MNPITCKASSTEKLHLSYGDKFVTLKIRHDENDPPPRGAYFDEFGVSMNRDDVKTLRDALTAALERMPE